MHPEQDTLQSRSTSRHAAPAETAQMSVLGRDGRDLESWNQPTSPLPPSRARKAANQWKTPSQTVLESESKASWWDGITTTASRWTIRKNNAATSSPQAAQEALDAAYASFDDESFASTLSTPPGQEVINNESFQPTDNKTRRIKKYYGRKNSKGTATFSLLQPQLEEGLEDGPKDLGEEHTQSTTKEDKIRQDCSFFYRDLDEVPSRKGGSKQTKPRLPGFSGDTYAHMMQYEPSRAAFQARYEQLNAQSVIIDDLELFNEEENVEFILKDDIENASPQFPRVANFRNSSLYYKQDGKVLMRMPQDKVKLLMDPHLQAGILSMEYAPYGNREPWKEQEIAYVLTVEDDLYRRVLKEMGDSYRAPCGLYYCCQEAESGGHVHIIIAIGVLTFVFIFLFVNTMIWPLD